MLSKCGSGEDSRMSLGLQGDQTRVSCIASEFSNFKNEGNSDMCYTWIKLEDVMPSEISQLQKEKSRTIPHT